MTLKERIVRNLVFLWDFLVLVLILFPLLTGGIWIKRGETVAFELSELGIPVLIVASFAGIFRVAGPPLTSHSLCMKAGDRVWEGWRNFLHRTPGVALSLGCIGIGLVLGWASLQRHWSFNSHAYDLGIFTNTLWNLVHGNGYISSVKGGINLFLDHQSPLFWALGPVFWIFQKPETLLLIQAFALPLGGAALYFLANQYLPNAHWGKAALPLLYWAYLPVRNANAFDFHPEVLMLPLFLWGIVGLQEKATLRRVLGGFGLILALGAKESAGAVLAGVGVGWLLGAGPQQTRCFTRMIGGLAIVLGTGIFYFDVKVVPEILGTRYAYNSLYKQFGDGLSDILLSPIRKPTLFWSMLSAKSRLTFVLWTLGPLGFLPLFNWRAAIAAVPGYLMPFLSQGDLRVQLIYHYAIEPSVGLFWALPGALRNCSGKPGTPEWRVRTIQWSLIFFALVFFGRSEAFRIRFHEITPHAKWLSRELIPRLDPSLPLAASDSLVPHLSTRSRIYSLTDVKTPAGSADCVLIDTGLSNWPLGSEEIKKLEGRLLKEGYEVRYRCGNVRLYEREAKCLRFPPGCK